MITSNDFKVHFTLLHKTLHNLRWFQRERLLGEGKKTQQVDFFVVLFPILYINPSWPDAHTPFFLLKIAFVGGRGVWVKKGLLTETNPSTWTSKIFRTQKIHSTYTYAGQTMSSYARQQNLGGDKVYFWKVHFSSCSLWEKLWNLPCQMEEQNKSKQSSSMRNKDSV